MHALLHDRRMTGRDKLKEKGAHLLPISQLSSEDQELLTSATQCVKKFAPKGQKKMRRSDNGHVTALKISDARPDEIVVSYSGDDIYSFDLLREPNADKGQSNEDSRTMQPCGDLSYCKMECVVLISFLQHSVIAANESENVWQQAAQLPWHTGQLTPRSGA